MMIGLNTSNNENINNQLKIPFPIQGNSDELHKIFTTPMTRSRNLEWVKKNLETLYDFLEYNKKKGSKMIIDLGAGDEVLADDIQRDYEINVMRVECYKKEKPKEKVKGGRMTMRHDIANMKNFPKGANDMYSIFTLQYIPNAAETIETIRSKLKVGCHAYLQFPTGLRSKKALEEFQIANEGKTFAIIYDSSNKEFGSIIFEVRKESENDEALTIPPYIVKNNIPLDYIDSGEKVPNSELFYHVFSQENDPELSQAAA